MERQADWDKIIIGIDPGTNVMGYGILGVRQRKPELIAMGVIMLSKFDDRYMRLRRIAERVTGLVEQYLPDEMALEAPFYGKNVQSMLKLGRAQGVAMAAALVKDIPIAEYAPLKVKQAITGNGAASFLRVAAACSAEILFFVEGLCGAQCRQGGEALKKRPFPSRKWPLE